MQLPDFFTVDPLTGYIDLVGHRIGFVQVVRLYDKGYSVEMIASRFPTLELALIHKAIAFYLENETEVSRWVAEDDAALVAMEDEHSRGVPTLAELRARLKAMQSVHS